MLDTNRLAETGCALAEGVCQASTVDKLRSLCGEELKPSERLRLDSVLMRETLAALAPIIARLSPSARAVRAVYFNKSAQRNWTVPWHQDRTIAVHARHDVQGFGPWSIKQGIDHVEPPFALLSAMITMRLHLDDCRESNAPLIVALGSHNARVESGEAAEHAAALPQLACIANIGDVWTYATPILHRSARMLSPGPRRVLQIDFSSSRLPEGLQWAD